MLCLMLPGTCLALPAARSLPDHNHLFTDQHPHIPFHDAAFQHLIAQSVHPGLPQPRCRIHPFPLLNFGWLLSSPLICWGLCAGTPCLWRSQQLLPALYCLQTYLVSLPVLDPILSFTKLLRSTGTKMDPCRTQLVIGHHLMSPHSLQPFVPHLWASCSPICLLSCGWTFCPERFCERQYWKLYWNIKNLHALPPQWSSGWVIFSGFFGLFWPGFYQQCDASKLISGKLKFPKSSWLGSLLAPQRIIYQCHCPGWEVYSRLSW